MMDTNNYMIYLPNVVDTCTAVQIEGSCMRYVLYYYEWGVTTLN